MTRPPSAAPGTDLIGAGLMVLAATCFATLGPLSRFAGDAGVEALTIVTWRAGIGAVVVTAIIALRFFVTGVRPASLRAIPRRDRWFMVAAAAANLLLNLAAFMAFERIEIALTLLVFYLYPAGVAIVSTTWFGERLDAVRWAALGLSLVGSALVVAGAGDLGDVDLVGVGLALAAAVMQAFYVLAARHGFARVPGPQAAALTMGGAFVGYLFLAAPLGALGAMAQPLAGTDALWPVVTAGVVGAGIPTFAFVLGIRRLGPSRAAILATLEPVVGVALAAWLLAELPTPVQIVGGVAILAAAILLQLRRQGPVSEHEAVAEAPDG